MIRWLSPAPRSRPMHMYVYVYVQLPFNIVVIASLGQNL